MALFPSDYPSLIEYCLPTVPVFQMSFVRSAVPNLVQYRPSPSLPMLCTGLFVNLARFCVSLLLLALKGLGPLGFLLALPAIGLLKAPIGLLSNAGLPALAARTSSMYVLGDIVPCGTLGGRCGTSGSLRSEFASEIFGGRGGPLLRRVKDDADPGLSR